MLIAPVSETKMISGFHVIASFRSWWSTSRLRRAKRVAKRQIKLARFALPIALRYQSIDKQARKYDWTQEEIIAAKRPLHEQYAPAVSAFVQKMAGFFIKTAQYALSMKVWYYGHRRSMSFKRNCDASTSTDDPDCIVFADDARRI